MSSTLPKRVIVVAAISADGFIGRDSDHLADWTSKEDKKVFVRLTKEAGVMIMGANTYRTIGRALPGRRNIVYSTKPLADEGIEVVSEPPAALLERLAREGHEAVAICGGQAIYDMFLQAGLVHELYLTVEPVLFGAGMSLMRASTAIELTLLDVEKLNNSTMLVHYGVTSNVSTY